MIKKILNMCAILVVALVINIHNVYAIDDIYTTCNKLSNEAGAIPVCEKIPEYSTYNTVTFNPATISDSKYYIFDCQSFMNDSNVFYDFQIPYNSVAIINVPGERVTLHTQFYGSNASFRTIGYSGQKVCNVIYNLYEAKTFSIEDVGYFYGSIIAPYADITNTDNLYNITTYGSIVSTHSSGTIGFNNFIQVDSVADSSPFDIFTNSDFAPKPILSNTTIPTTNKPATPIQTNTTAANNIITLNNTAITPMPVITSLTTTTTIPATVTTSMYTTTNKTSINTTTTTNNTSTFTSDRSTTEESTTTLSDNAVSDYNTSNVITLTTTIERNTSDSDSHTTNISNNINNMSKTTTRFVRTHSKSITIVYGIISLIVVIVVTYFVYKKIK